jgi:hypothetical protein
MNIFANIVKFGQTPKKIPKTNEVILKKVNEVVRLQTIKRLMH